MYRVVCRAVSCQLSAEQHTEQWSGEPRLAAIVLPTFRIIHPWPRCEKKGEATRNEGSEEEKKKWVKRVRNESVPRFDRRDDNNNNNHHIDTSHSTLSCRRPTSYTLFRPFYL